MGWFDDNHWAGEAYDFGFGYMCGGRGLDAYASSSAAHRDFDGHYEPGTRKCSQCLQFKTKKDFNREQAAIPAKKRICNACGPGLPSDIGCMKVAELKQELGSRGLSTTGPRNDLVDRLKDDIERKETATKRKARAGSGTPALQKQRKEVALPRKSEQCEVNIASEDRSASSSRSDEDEIMELLTKASNRGKQWEAAKYLWTCAQEGRPLPKFKGGSAINMETLRAALAKLPGFDVGEFEADRHRELVGVALVEYKCPEPKRAKGSDGRYQALGA